MGRGDVCRVYRVVKERGVGRCLPNPQCRHGEGRRLSSPCLPCGPGKHPPPLFCRLGRHLPSPCLPCALGRRLPSSYLPCGLGRCLPPHSVDSADVSLASFPGAREGAPLPPLAPGNVANVLPPRIYLLDSAYVFPACVYPVDSQCLPSGLGRHLPSSCFSPQTSP